MSKLTGLFIDAANENIDALPKRLSDLGVRYPKEREGEFLAELRELYYRYYGASLSEVDPIQVIREGFQLIYSMNLQPARRASSCSTGRSRRSARSARSSIPISTSSRSRGRTRAT